MTREEILAVAKPILFNTEMVCKVLDGTKTATRRPIKPQPFAVKQDENAPCWCGHFVSESGKVLPDKPPYRTGDILYVPEAWRCTERCTSDFYEIEFRDGKKVKVDFTSETRRQKWLKYIDKPRENWQSPYFMPKEAARIFLRVTDVRVERLQDITEEQAEAEGMPDELDYPISEVYCPVCKGYGFVGACYPETLGFFELECHYCNTPRKRFSNLWDSTIKPADRAIYGWDENPWVWVIEFEKMEAEK